MDQPGTYSVAIGDLNGDGVMDLVTANNEPVNTVSVLLNAGNGSFASAVEYAVGDDSNPLQVAIGDLNGDGVMDLVTANVWGMGTVSVLFGNGDGTFASSVAINAGGVVTGVAIGDLNGDGIMDLATANGWPNFVGILFGVGHGEFASPVEYTSGWAFPFSVAIGDLNGDGVPDLAVAENGGPDYWPYYPGHTVGILLGAGGGMFPAQPVHYRVGRTENAVPLRTVIGDLNGDGFMDLVTANLHDNSVSILLGVGDGTFTSAVSYDVGGGPDVPGNGSADQRGPWSVAIGDLNGDGILDIATPLYMSNTVSVLLGVGDGTFTGAVTYDVGSGPTGVAIGDLNVDGSMDLATANSLDGTVSLLLSN
jgi:FG-GAP-like repeat/FG-GAP repeat